MKNESINHESKRNNKISRFMIIQMILAATLAGNTSCSNNNKKIKDFENEINEIFNDGDGSEKNDYNGENIEFDDARMIIGGETDTNKNGDNEGFKSDKDKQASDDFGSLEGNEQINNNESDDENTMQNNDSMDDSIAFKELINKQSSPINHVETNQSEISITIDDGNGRHNVDSTLNILNKYGVHGTFFILGYNIKNFPDLWKDAIENGHQVCCHTYHHIYLGSEYTNMKSSLNKAIYIETIENDITRLLGNDYLIQFKRTAGDGYPNTIKSDVLLEAEILMREAQVRQSLGEEYLQKMKSSYPFFRFPGGNGATESNINVLKRLGYLAIYWSDDFQHISTPQMSNLNVKNGDLPLFHFKEVDFKRIEGYIHSMEKNNKSSVTLSDLLKDSSNISDLSLESK